MRKNRTYPVYNKQAKKGRTNFGSVKKEQIMKRNESPNGKMDTRNEITMTVKKITDFERRKELIQVAKEVIDEFDYEDPMDGGLLF